ncbi:MAG: SLC26A/SulP transporter family protein [Chloroflexi bacterium]|nr:SLC26A/SulP transporter family protein [Chloroflexota bacterium]
MFQPKESPVSFRRLSPVLRLKQLLPSLTAGLVLGVIQTTLALAFASLIFSGRLSAHIPTAIGIMLLAQMIINSFIALTTSVPGLIAGLQDVSAAVLAVIAAAIVDQMSGSATSDEIFWTVVAALTLASLSTGIALWLLGRFKLGNLVRFIPYPVIGGFLGGTGLLLVRGGISVLTGQSLDLGNLAALLEADVWIKWLPGLIFAGLLWFILRHSSSPLIVPGMVLSGIAAFYIGLTLSGASLAEAGREGWLMISQEESGRWEPWSISAVKQIDWGVISGQVGSLGMIAALSAVSLLLNATGLELLLQQDIDLNRELKSAGVGNILTGLVGGGVGFQTISASMLADKLGAKRTRLPGIFVALFCGLILVFGGGLLAYIPNVVLGGLVLFLGVALLVEWIYEAWFKLSLIDYAMVIVILLVMNAAGFLEGVGLGMVIAVILFAINYSQISVVKQTLNGATYHSHVVRSTLYQGLLRSKGDWLYILKLQGFLFFGTATTLLNHFQQRLADPALPNLKYVVFDFRLVTGLDSSAELGFRRIQQLAQTHGIGLVFTHLSPQAASRLNKEILQGENCQVFPDLDHGVEWCENHLIEKFTSVGLVAHPKTFMQQIKEVLPSPQAYSDLMQYFECQEVGAGDYLIRQGEQAAGIFFIETGQVSVELETHNGQNIRVRRMEAGTLVGETGVYLNRPATASVIASQSTTVYCLKAEALRQIETTTPEIAAAFHRFVASYMTERLGHTTEVLQALAD